MRKKCLFFVIGSVCALMCMEGGIRLFRYKFIRYLDTPMRLGQFFDPDVGYLNTPTNEGLFDNQCVTIHPIYVNSKGFRSGEWNEKTGFKIAVLGDSFMEAKLLSEGDYTAPLLGQLLNINVYNAAAGGSGTVKQLLVYKKFLRPLKPDIVILFFLPENDPSDNSCELFGKMYHYLYQPCASLSNGKMKISRPSPDPYAQSETSGIRRLIKKNCLSCTVMYRFAYEKLYRILRQSSMDEWRLTYFSVYVPLDTRQWQEAWAITEQTLRELKEEIEKDGGRLLVVSAFSNVIFLNDLKKEIEKGLGIRFSPTVYFDRYYPLRKTERICKELGIPFLILEPYFFSYQQKYNVREPYFSFWCDGHWNPLGHFLASHIVARYLIEQGWFPLGEKEKEWLMRRIDENLKLSPTEILGREAYQQIYKHGMYLGSSRIKEILERGGH